MTFDGTFDPDAAIVPLDQLNIGQDYLVSVNDCCAVLSFVSRFCGYDYDPQDGDPVRARFETAIIDQMWGSYTVRSIT